MTQGRVKAVKKQSLEIYDKKCIQLNDYDVYCFALAIVTLGLCMV